MIKIDEKSACCGCYGCYNICPKQCISMKTDSEGFWYPNINEEKCINCGLCEKVCPVINSIEKEYCNTSAYACKNKDEKVRLSSSSGGVFTNLCEYTISNNGVVFGAAFNESFKVEHMEANTLKECEKFRGSKYVQSSIGKTYKKVKEYLECGKIVLFSGTQCQIKGLNLFLGKKYDNLISVDIICHGVPSPLVFDMYKRNLSMKYQSDIMDIEFRDKSKGWKKYSYTTKFKNGSKRSRISSEDIYMRGFLSNLYLRPSCYKCKAKNFNNNSDISLADYWGVENKHLEFDDDKGISLVLINSKKGKEIFDYINNNMEVICTDLDYAISNNPCIVRPVKLNHRREEFFQELDYKNINCNIEKCIKLNIIQRMKNKIKYIIRNEK